MLINERDVVDRSKFSYEIRMSEDGGGVEADQHEWVRKFL